VLPWSLVHRLAQSLYAGVRLFALSVTFQQNIYDDD